MNGFVRHIARKTCTLQFKGSLYIVMNPTFVLFFIFTSRNILTSVYSLEHIPGVKKQSQNTKLNLPLKIQGVHMFDEPIFFTVPIF